VRRPREVGSCVVGTVEVFVQSLFGYIYGHLFTVADSTWVPTAELAIGCREVISILLGRKRSTKGRIYGELGRDEIQFYLP